MTGNGRLQAAWKVLAFAALLLAMPAKAIVGGGTPQSDGIAQSVITIVGSRGNFCSGSLIAPRLVLTAAHCVPGGADYKIIAYGSDGKPQLQNIRGIAVHPGFNLQAIQAHRATADVALLQLDIPLKGKSSAQLAAALTPMVPGARLVIAGVGVSVPGDGKSGGTTRVAALVVTGRPGSLQVRLVDPLTNGVRDGIGACTGDSGGPVVEDRPTGPVIVGVISWSTGSNGSAGCGGLTGVTPLSLYREWIVQTARSWGAAL